MVLSSKTKNFKYLDDLIHSGVGEIVLDSDVSLFKGEEAKYFEGIELDVCDVIIDAGGHTIDGCGKARIFNCTARNVTIRNAVLKNGFALESGGAIFNEGNLNIFDSIFKNNCATEYTGSRGGAIHNDGNMNIANSILSDNVAEFVGGAINNTGKLKIIESRILDNSTEGMGGAIFNEGLMDVKSSHFFSNSVRWMGGEIYQNRDTWLIMRPRGSFGSVEGSGGAIYNSGELELSNSQFSSNCARQWGGAIRNLGNLKVIGSILEKNIAKECGAAVDNSGGFNMINCKIIANASPNKLIFNEDFLEIHSTEFKDNESEIIVFNDKKANLSIFGAKFAANICKKATVYNEGNYCVIEKTNFKDSTTSKNVINITDLTLINPKMDGESIFNNGHILIKKSSEKLKIDGGTVDYWKNPVSYHDFGFGYLDERIHQDNTGKIVLDRNIIFQDFERDFYEGGIELDIDDLIIDGNGKVIDACDKTRIFLITGNNVTLKNITFRNGHSYKNYNNPLNCYGGAIKINSDVKLTVEDCKFISNISEENGGAIHNSGELIVDGSSLSGNRAFCGGAISNTNVLTVIDSEFSENEAGKKGSEGGAIYNKGVRLDIVRSQLSVNIANWGGAIFSENSVVHVSGSELLSNSARDGGGAIYVETGDLSIQDSSLSGNTSNLDGGAISNQSAKITIYGCDFSSNKSRHSGGAISGYEGKFEIENSIFSSNSSEFGGNAIFMNSKNDLILKNCSIGEGDMSFNGF